MTATLEINDMQFYAFHGCLPEEALIGTNYTVSVEFKFSIANAANSDQIKDTIDYGEVFSICQRVMQVRKNLIEAVAQSMLQALLDRFKQTESIQLKLCKIQPPIVGPVKKACITLHHFSHGI